MRNTPPPPPCDSAGQNPYPAAARPIPAASEPATIAASATASDLTPEEQLALFELELKSADSGHQPC